MSCTVGKKRPLSPSAARNCAGANKQMIGAEQNISSAKRTSLGSAANTPIHNKEDENEMLLLLGVIHNHPASMTSIETDIGLPGLIPAAGDGNRGPPVVPKQTIARRGTIIMSLGDGSTTFSDPPKFPKDPVAWEDNFFLDMLHLQFYSR